MLEPVLVKLMFFIKTIQSSILFLRHSGQLRLSVYPIVSTSTLFLRLRKPSSTNRPRSPNCSICCMSYMCLFLLNIFTEGHPRSKIPSCASGSTFGPVQEPPGASGTLRDSARRNLGSIVVEEEPPVLIKAPRARALRAG